MATEAFGWAILVAVSVAYMHTHSEIPKPKALGSPSAQLEVDPTRWRHNGEQPISHREGNQMPFEDEQVKRLALAF
jgi:hypothetical protein